MIPIARPLLGEEEKALVWEAMQAGQLAQGPRVRQFEERFADFVGVPHAVATSSGTTAIQLALLAHGIGSGDEVITSSLTFVATATAVLHVGARPVFADVEATTFHLDPERVEAAITPRTRALLPVHLYGAPAAMRELMEIAGRHGLAVIEDAAQAHGASLNGRQVGAWGTGCFSFYATKNLTCAEGGMVTTADSAVADRVRLLREHGARSRYVHEMLGFNYRMTDIHASIGLAQLAKLQANNARRQAIAQRYDRELQGVIKPSVQTGGEHVYHLYTLRVPRRDAFLERLHQRGVGAGVYYPIPAHRQQAVIAAGAGGEHLPVTDRLAGEIISIPIHPSLTHEEVASVVDAVNEVAEQLADGEALVDAAPLPHGRATR